MAHAKLSPSASKRWMNCPGSVRLIEEGQKAGRIKEKPSRAAAQGTVAHTIGEKCLRDEIDADSFIGDTMSADGFDFVVDDEMAAAVQIYVDYVKDHMRRAIEADILVECRVEVKCSLKALEIPGLDGGTSDAVIICREHEFIEVIDYKHGENVKVDAEHNTQAMQYALGALMKLEREGVDVARYKVYITIVQPRANWDKPISNWETSVTELYEWCNDELIPKAQRCHDPDAPVVPGDEQCQFCTVEPDCPERYKQTQEVALVDFEAINCDGLDTAEMPPVKALTVEQKIKVLQHRSAIKKFMDAVNEHVKDEIQSGSSEYNGYYKLVEGKSDRRLTDEAKDADFSPLLDILEHDEIFEFRTKNLSSIENAIKLKFKEQGVKTFAKAAKTELSKFCFKPKGGATLVPVSDKRPEIEIETSANEFDHLVD